jgi:hypothetical protein
VFHPSIIARTVQTVVQFFHNCAQSHVLQTQTDRAYIIRIAVTSAQHKWMARVPSHVDIHEIFMLALELFDYLSVEDGGSFGNYVFPNTVRSKDRINTFTHCLLLAERIVHNDNFRIAKRTDAVGQSFDTMVSGMQRVVAVHQGNMQRAGLYSLMRVLIELQFGLWWPSPTAAEAEELVKREAVTLSTSLSRGRDSMHILRAVMVDPQCYRFHPVQLCISVWWVCQAKWSQRPWVTTLAWDGNLDPLLAQHLSQVCPAANFTHAYLIDLASRHLLPLLCDLVQQAQLPLKLHEQVQAILKCV